MPQIIEVGEDIWTVEHDVFMPGKVHFPARMVVVRLSDGTLLLHSPTPLDDHLIAQLESLGDVAHIVAPNKFHHLFFASAAEAFPKAQRWVAPGLAAKCPNLEFDETLSDSAAPWANDLQQVWIAGVPAINETVFYHSKSGTLICTDLMFHLREVQNWWSRWLFKSLGVWQTPAQSKLWRFVMRDRAQAAASVQQVLQWPFKRVVMAHGEALSGPEAKVEFVMAMGWMLKGAARAELPA